MSGMDQTFKIFLKSKDSRFVPNERFGRTKLSDSDNKTSKRWDPTVVKRIDQSHHID